MTSRERVKAAINHNRPDRMPCNESPWEDTIKLWHEQGLPEGVSLADYFGFDICHMSLDCSPRFEQKIIKHEGEFYTYQDRYGYTAKNYTAKQVRLLFPTMLLKTGKFGKSTKTGG